MLNTLTEERSTAEGNVVVSLELSQRRKLGCTSELWRLGREEEEEEQGKNTFMAGGRFLYKQQLNLLCCKPFE